MSKEALIKHRGFDRIVDENYVDIEDIPIQPVSHLLESKNAIIGRKFGSSSIIEDIIVEKAYSALPNPTSYNLTGWTCVDYYIFGLDKDKKEIYILVYQKDNGSDIRMFVGPWYNPILDFSNYRSLYTAGSWITGWIELTESYSAVVKTVAVNQITTESDLSGTITEQSGYLDKFFIVNMYRDLTRGFTRTNRFNYITSHTYSSGPPATHTLNLKGNITGLTSSWDVDDPVKIYRFPCIHFYNASVNGYGDEGTAFTGKPTQFKYRENELRMPCGKDKRPLLLSFIQNRKYFLGNEHDMSYDGFWLDFQQIPQVMSNSAITGFVTRSGGVAAGTDWSLCSPMVGGATPTIWVAPGAATSWVRITRRTGVGTLSAAVGDITFPPAGSSVIIPNKCIYVPSWNQLVFQRNMAGTLAQADFVAAFNNSAINPHLYPTYTAAVDVVANLTTPASANAVSKTFTGTGGGIFTGKEAGGNDTAENLFLGTSVYAVDAAAGTQQRNLHILNAIIDNRSQILMSHGTYSAKVDSEGLVVRFNLWFSRRLTGMSFFNQKLEDVPAGTVATYIVTQEKYPYFLYIKEMGTVTPKLNINELKHFSHYDIYDFSRALNGELVFGLQAVVTPASGINAYTYDATIAKWYVIFQNGKNGIAMDGKGSRYVAKCNRYIDQDTTMNYTRCEFLGQTNGRFFLIGVKNTVERVTFESNDIVVYNIYAGAVSEYDTYLRDRFMPVAFGDKDQLITIENYNGYMFLVKETNSYGLEVNTDTEVKYRTTETRLGRGIMTPDQLLQTPHGLVMATDDGVLLITPEGTERLLTEDNGKLYLYKTLFEYYGTRGFDSMVYNQRYDELLIELRELDEVVPSPLKIHILIYNFGTKTWTGQYYMSGTTASVNMCRPTRLRTNTSKKVVFINWGDATRWNIASISNSSSPNGTFLNADETTTSITFEITTPYLALADRVDDILLQKIKLNYDYFYDGTAASNLSLVIDRFGTGTTETISLTLPVNALVQRNKTSEIIPGFKGVSELIQLKITNTRKFRTFNLNSIIEWIATQSRRRLQ